MLSSRELRCIPSSPISLSIAFLPFTDHSNSSTIHRIPLICTNKLDFHQVWGKDLGLVDFFTLYHFTQHWSSTKIKIKQLTCSPYSSKPSITRVLAKLPETIFLEETGSSSKAGLGSFITAPHLLSAMEGVVYGSILHAQEQLKEKPSPK